MTRTLLVAVGLVLLGSVAATTATADLTDGLLLYLSYDDTMGVYDLAHDFSGNEHNGTITNPAQLLGVAGKLNGGAEFSSWDPQASPFATIKIAGVPADEVPSSAITVAAWVNLDRVFEPNGTTIERNTIFSTMAEPDGVNSTTKGTGGITLDIRGTLRDVEGTPTQGQTYRWVLRGTDSVGERNAHSIVDYEYGRVDPDPLLPVRIEQWVHVAATYDKSAASAALYLDGVKVFDYPVLLQDLDIDTDWYRCYISQFVEGAREFRGIMDELRVYTPGLDGAEIRSLVGVVMGDANLDHVVDDKDASILGANWLQSGAY